MSRFAFFCTGFLSVALLTGCAITPRVDADVQSFAKWPAAALTGAQIRYKFERLPSQQEGSAAESQAQLETQAKAVFSRLGWQESGSDATHSVSLQLRTGVADDYRWRGIGGFGLWGGSGWGLLGPEYIITRSGQIIPLPHRSLHDWQFYQRELAMGVRDLSNQTVVYEASAKHESRRSDTTGLVSLLVDAALDGFPTPPAGVRRVTRVDVSSSK